ncbi:MAG: matrixin family metalloprotease [Pseudomonadota bacterium]
MIYGHVVSAGLVMLVAGASAALAQGGDVNVAVAGASSTVQRAAPVPRPSPKRGPSRKMRRAAHKLLRLGGGYLKWGAPRLGSAADVTYAFVRRHHVTRGARNCQAMVPLSGLLAASPSLSLAVLRRAAREAFAMWSAVAAIRFHEVQDVALANILIGAQARPRGTAFANVQFEPLGTQTRSRRDSTVRRRPGAVHRLTRSLVCLNPRQRWKVGFDGDLLSFDLRYTFAHEIGHAIGLDHPPARGQLMGYRYTEQFAGLQFGDVRGVVQLYGRPLLKRLRWR